MALHLTITEPLYSIFSMCCTQQYLFLEKTDHHITVLMFGYFVLSLLHEIRHTVFILLYFLFPSSHILPSCFLPLPSFAFVSFLPSCFVPLTSFPLVSFPSHPSLLFPFFQTPLLFSSDHILPYCFLPLRSFPIVSFL